jgi:hypothetical protein
MIHGAPRRNESLRGRGKGSGLPPFSKHLADKDTHSQATSPDGIDYTGTVLRIPFLSILRAP